MNRNVPGLKLKEHFNIYTRPTQRLKHCKDVSQEVETSLFILYFSFTSTNL